MKQGEAAPKIPYPKYVSHADFGFSAPPDDDWQVPELQLTTLITDRPAVLETTHLGGWKPLPPDASPGCAARTVHGLARLGYILISCASTRGIPFDGSASRPGDHAYTMRIVAAATVDFSADAYFPKTWNTYVPTRMLWAGTVAHGAAGPDFRWHAAWPYALER